MTNEEMTEEKKAELTDRMVAFVKSLKQKEKFLALEQIEGRNTELATQIAYVWLAKRRTDPKAKYADLLEFNDAELFAEMDEHLPLVQKS